MAHVLTCDKCGRPIKTKSWPLDIRYYRSILWMEDATCRYEYDLCDECTKKLNEFLEKQDQETTEE